MIPTHRYLHASLNKLIVVTSVDAGLESTGAFWVGWNPDAVRNQHALIVEKAHARKINRIIGINLRQNSLKLVFGHNFLSSISKSKI